MKISKTIGLLLSICILFSCVTGVCGAELTTPATSGCRGIDAQMPIGGNEKIVETAKAVMIYERTTGTLVYSYNPDAMIYPSSMVKLMTTLVALEQGVPDSIVTVTRSALDSVAIGSVSAGLVRGEQMTLKDLLYCVMVQSANDAAAVVAEHIGGTQEQFIAMMNDKAAQLGCKDTHFSNVHGLHDEDTYTTARDVLRLLDHCLQIPEFKTMFETAKYTVPATNKSDERVIHTTNYMISREVVGRCFDSRVTGGKTGSTDQAGRCLAVTAKVSDLELIGIVMGAKAVYSEDKLSIERFGSFEEMTELLDYTQKHYEIRQLYYEGQVIAQYPVANGANHVVTMPAEESYCVLPKQTTAQELTWKYTQSLPALTAPISKGQTITQLQIWYGDICLAQTDLIAMNGVAVFTPYKEPQSTSDIKNEQEHGQIIAVVMLVLFGAAVAVILVVFLLRLAKRAVLRARIRRRRKNRRRNRNARME